MKKLTLTLTLVPLVAGCSGLGRPLLDAAGAGGGAVLAHQLSDGDPLVTGAGAVGGVLLSEGGQALVSGGQKKSYDAGYQKGQSDSVKTWYHQLEDQQRQPANPPSESP